jgi:hypothetical protein
VACHPGKHESSVLNLFSIQIVIAQDLFIFISGNVVVWTFRIVSPGQNVYVRISSDILLWQVILRQEVCGRYKVLITEVDVQRKIITAGLINFNM